MEHAASKAGKGSEAIHRREFVPRDAWIGVQGSSKVVHATMAGDRISTTRGGGGE